MSKKLIEIDGSVMEGGGQILRMAVTLSALTQTPIRVTNIRAGRSKPGLMEQHLRGIELVRDISSAKLNGGRIGSTEIEFWPNKLRGGNFYAGVKTAGSISLLLQVALPCTLFADSPTSITLEGGTNAEMAPQIDYTTEVFRTIMEKFGATFDFNLVKRGYYPKGGGKVVVTVKPVSQLYAVEMLDFGKITALYGWSFVAGSLPINIAHKMSNGAANALKKIYRNVKIENYKEDPCVAPDNCSGIVLVLETSTNCILGGSALGKRSEMPDATGAKAADEIIKAYNEGACVDDHSQDQIIVLMALAQGCSKVRVGKLTLHTETAIYVAEKLTNVKFELIPQGSSTIIQCNGMGLTS